MPCDVPGGDAYGYREGAQAAPEIQRELGLLTYGPAKCACPGQRCKRYGNGQQPRQNSEDTQEDP